LVFNAYGLTIPTRCQTGSALSGWVGEAEPVAYFLNQKGMTVVCVKYCCPWRPEGMPKHAFAWADAQRAIRLVRAGAPARGLDPDRIGALGFSAGGHLTLLTALSSGMPAYEPKDEIDRFSCAVQWACPIYPAYALTDGSEKPNAHGGNLDEDVPVPEFAFDSATPPMCFVHGDDDCWASIADAVAQGNETIVDGIAWIVRLCPEGSPAADLAAQHAADHRKIGPSVRARSKVKRGVLLQSTMGHGGFPAWRVLTP